MNSWMRHVLHTYTPRADFPGILESIGNLMSCGIDVAWHGMRAKGAFEMRHFPIVIELSLNIVERKDEGGDCEYARVR